jgi:glutaconate CoA-transferase subunit B
VLDSAIGAAYLYYIIPRVILFREEHTPRIFVDQVDFVSAPGTSDESVYRTGGPAALLTGKCLFRFDQARPGFVLDSVHPGHDLASVKQATGFAFAHSDRPAQTPLPDTATLALLRSRVMDELSETYPEFANQMQEDLRRVRAQTTDGVLATSDETR